MSKQIVINQEKVKKKKEKLDLEGIIFYFLLVSVIALLPIGSAYWLLSVA